MITADAIYINGVIYSADEQCSTYSAMAIQDGVILDLGDDQSILSYQTNETNVVDLQGQFMMPGLIDAHLHPFWGASQSLSCDLKHKILSKQEILEIIEQYITEQVQQDAQDWIIVRGWMQPDMLPIGSELTKQDLDNINQNLPIVVFSNDCHVLVCNSAALVSFKTVDITDEDRLKGILVDGPAMQAFDEITRYSDAFSLIVAKKAQGLLNQQGVTTVMDARADDIAFKAFRTLAEKNELTLRVFGAREIPAKSFSTKEMIPNTIENVCNFMQEYSFLQIAKNPTTTISHIKFFIDGVLQEPLHTALLQEPYNLDDKARYGDCYYDKELLTELLSQTNQLGWYPHMHTVGDAAIDFALDCIEASQKNSKNELIRPSLAHNELTRDEHFDRFVQLNVVAAQSLQWAAMDLETHHAFSDLLGEKRIQNFECAGKFYDAGVKVAYGSDWPIDHLNLWSHFQVGMNRQLMGDSFKHDNDRDLTTKEVLHSVTIDAAYMLGQEHHLGSLEIGKFADFIVLNQNPFRTLREKIHTIEVDKVFLGGKEIFLRRNT